MNQILECVPNFSEGRNLEVIEKLCDCFRGKPGVRLLDYTWDHDHNRCVLTVIGEPEPLGMRWWNPSAGPWSSLT